MQKGYNLYNVEPQFRKFLAAENISAISLKNYLSDFRHFAAWLDFYLSSHSVIPRDHSVILSEAKDPDAGIIVSVLTPEILSEYRGYLVENKFTHKTINRRLSTVRRFCSFCISQGWLKENPAKKISNIGQNFSSLPLKIDGVESKKEAPQGPISSILGAPSTILDTPRVILKAVKNLVKRKPPVIPSLSRDLAKRESSFTLGIQHYIGLIIILVFMATLGAGIYTQFFAKSQPSLAYPTALTRAGRLLSFQGRLTDSLGNPITTATNVTYKLYSVSTGGTALYTAGACSTTPDQDGIFSTLIGGSGYSPTPPQDVCGSEIDSSVFSENANVYLGVTVASDSEMTPRQQIANVGYAINAETLQGFPPGTGTSTVPYINSDGDVLIAASNPDIASTYASSTFTISSANATTIQSAGTGDIVLQATESGAISLRTGGSTSTYTQLYVDTEANGGNVGIGTITPLEKLDVNGNATVSGNLTLAGGARTIASRAFNQLNIGDSQTGDILLSPGTGKQIRFFNTSNYIDSSGNIVIDGTTTFNGIEYTWPATISTNDYVLSAQTDGTLAWVEQTGGGGGESLWTITNGSIYPLNSTVDLFVGGTATTSAKFKVLNINSGTPTASISGTTSNVATFVDGNGNISTTNRADLVLGNSSTYNSTGNVLLNPNGTGNVGISDTAPASLFSVGTGGLFQIDSSGRIVSIDGVAHTIDDASGDLTLTSNSTTISLNDNTSVVGTLTLPNSNTLTGVTNYTQFSNGLSVGGGTTYYLDASGNLNANNVLTGGTTRIDPSGNLTDIGTTEFNGITYTWPGSIAVNDYVLSAQTDGTLAWVEQTGGGGGESLDRKSVV